MKIERAIEIKRKYQYLLQDASLPELIEADKISIEALKVIENTPGLRAFCQFKLLPGETED